MDTDDQIDLALPGLSNWGRWGRDDELGTLNYITPERRLEAAALVRAGTAVSLARQVTLDAAEGVERGTHELTQRPGGGARDYIGLVFHGFTVTHLDALCHVSDGRLLYNGHSDAPDHGGYARGGVQSMATAGIVGRGVLMDVARLRGRALEPGEAIGPDELGACARADGLVIQSGDLVWIRTGAGQHNTRDGRAGLDADCLQWLRDREVALLGSDGDSDVAPTTLDRWASPIHSVGIWQMGLALVDNAELDPLSETAHLLGRWEFLCAVLPLPFRGITGSPVNPLALF